MFELDSLNSTMVSSGPPATLGIEADPADVATPEAVIDAYWRIASQPAGQRNWAAMEALFHPEAGFRSTIFRTKAHGLGIAFVPSFHGYRNWCEGMLDQNALYESDLVRKVDRYGHMAIVQNSVVCRNTPDGEPFAWTIKNWQLFWDEQRWWVVTIMTEVYNALDELPEEWRGHA
jgi:hypothetical protein